MTITVTIAIPAAGDYDDSEINQWVKDVTKHSPTHYVVKGARIKSPRMQITRADGSTSSYRQTSSGDWTPSSFDFERVENNGEV